jgi:hypothetical protein
MSTVVATTGTYNANLPSWGRCFWQDPNDGALFLAFASGNNEVDYITSSNSGVTWAAPARLFPVDNFTNDNNFDICMDRRGHVHSVFKWQGSGCYQFTGKSGATWTNSSGVGPAGFCLTTDGASSSKGLHGSIFIADGPLGLFGDPVTKFPAARIACKKADQEVESWYVSHPFNTYPVMQSGAGSAGDKVSKVGDQAGPGGGYPIINDAGNFNGLAVQYSASGALIRNVHAQFGNLELLNAVPIVRDPSHTGAGTSGLIPFGAQMCFTSGIIGKLNPVLVSAASGFEMYTTFAETNGVGAGFTRIDSTASLAVLGNRRRATNGFPWMVAGPSGNILGIAPGLGTLVDMTHNNTKDTLHIYYLGPNSLGIYAIHRVLCRVQREVTNTASTNFEFSSSSHLVSGVKSFAPAVYNYTGGSANKAFWKGFKALKHPVRGGEGVSKKEMVVTIGSEPIYPSGFNLVVWDYADDPSSFETIHFPTYDYNYIATSGNSVSAFSGILSTSRVTTPDFAFNNDLNNDALVSSGSALTVQFSKPILIDRLEMITFGSSSSNRFPGVIFSGSMDGTNWTWLHTSSSGYTTSPIKLSAENPRAADVNERIDPWVMKYLKMDFQQSQKRSTNTYNLTELRFFGPGQFMGQYATQAIIPTKIRPEASRGTEKFRSTTEGGLPTSDWSTSGNFTWGVRASGNWSYSSSLTTQRAPQNGYVGSGIFTGDSNGNGDGFSLKSNDCTPPLTSGIVQVNTKIYSTDVSSSGVSSRRTMQFDIRTDFVASDDRLDLYVASLGLATEGTLIRRFDSNIDWTTVSFDVGAGDQTIKWIYTRGATSGNSLNIGSVWIDNVVGLLGPTQPAIGGFIEGSTTPASGAIYSYMNSAGFMAINAYMSGSPFYNIINGYLDATVTSSGAIHGYISAGMDTRIHGYMNGVGTPVDAIIYGVMGSGTPFSSNNIYGFMRAEGESNRIHGYLFTPSGITNNIYGFVSAGAPSGTIHGYLFGTSQPSGQINGYLLANIQQSAIYGYIGNNALVPSGGGTVAGGPGGLGSSTSGIGPINWINGYLRAEGEGQRIYGYLEGPPGKVGQIYGYMPVGGSENIYGYLAGATPSSGNIYGYINAVGAASGVVYGYMYGVSGIISNSSYGYLAGVQFPSGYIYGFMIGIPSGANSLGTCISHGISLPIVVPAVIPSSCFNL